jgi:hypothetical protein
MGVIADPNKITRPEQGFLFYFNWDFNSTIFKLQNSSVRRCIAPAFYNNNKNGEGL